MFGKIPRVHYFRTFGCLAWVWLPDAVRTDKLSPKAEAMTFIGYERGSKAWIFMRKDNSKFIGSTAQFNELYFPRLENNKPSPPGTKQSWDDEDSSDDDNNNYSPHRTSTKKPDEQQNYQESDQEEELEQSQYYSPESDDISEQELEDKKDIIPKTPEKSHPPPSTKLSKSKKKVMIQTPPVLRRSSRLKKPNLNVENTYGSKKATDILQQRDKDFFSELYEDQPESPLKASGSSQLLDDDGNKAVKMLLSKAIEVVDVCPETFKDVDKLKETDPDLYKSWFEAMKGEVKALDDRDVWELVDCPKERKTIRCRWVFSIKSDGHKRARLVAKGFSQIPGIDFEDTFSPVARFETVRLLLATAALEDWEIEALDVKTAFLYGDLDEILYMNQPEGFVKKGQEGKVYRLKKALYGLKQASLAWNKAANLSLEQLGFKRLISDSGIYKLGSNNETIIVILYVDDVLFMGSNSKLLMNKKNAFMKKWECRDLGPISEYLGMKILRDRKSKILKIDQIDYAKKIVKRFGQENCHDVTTPLPGGYKPQSQSPDQRATPEQLNYYQSIIGSLLYLTLGTRPDIAYAVILMSQFMSNPSEDHIKKAIHIIKYVKSTLYAKLIYNGKANEGLHGYADADWGSDVDTRKSVTGYVIKLAGAPISWTSRKQKTVALSSTEAEYMSLTDAIKQLVWMKSLFKELGSYIHKIELNIDNQGAMFIAQNDVVDRKMKHIDIKYHYCRDVIKDGSVQLLFVPTNEQQADIFTKNLNHIKFKELRSQIGVQIPQRGGVLRL